MARAARPEQRQNSEPGRPRRQLLVSLSLVLGQTRAEINQATNTAPTCACILERSSSIILGSILWPCHGGGLLARLLTIAVLLTSVRFVLANHTDMDYPDGYNKLQSYAYVVASAIVGVAGSVLQVPVALYLLCKSKRAMPSAMILDVSMHADMVISVVLASGVGAGFGATNDVLRYVRVIEWKGGSSERQDLTDYYNRAIVALIFLLVGMILSFCATVVSARLRAKAINESEV